MVVRVRFNPLSANPTKWSNTLKQFVGKKPTNCLSVFDHFVGLALKGLIYNSNFILCTDRARICFKSCVKKKRKCLTVIFPYFRAISL